MDASVANRTVLPPIGAEAHRSRRSLSRWIRRGIIATAMAGLIVTLRLTYFRTQPVPVTVVRAELGLVESLVTNNRAGTVTSRRRASLVPEIGGRVAQLHVAEGDRVRQGEALLTLAGADLRAQVVLQERSLDAARSAATEACALAEHAARERERNQLLFTAGAIAAQTLAEADMRWKTAVASCDAAQARIAQAAAAVTVAQTALDKTTLRSPFDAIVTKINTHAGEWLIPSPPGLPVPPAVEVVDITSIYVRAPLDEVDAAHVRAGMPARITMDAFAGRSFAGRLTHVGAYVSELQQQNRTFDIDVAFDDAGFARTLLPGTSADVEVILSAHDEALRLPTSAILPGSRVLVVRKGILVGVPIRMGLANWEFTEVLGGLEPGEQVVVSLDRQEVREGARVVATESGK